MFQASSRLLLPRLQIYKTPYEEVATATASMCFILIIEQKFACWHVSDGFNSYAYRYSVITWSKMVKQIDTLLQVKLVDAML